MRIRPRTGLPVATVVNAGITANAWQPVRRTGALSLPAFAVGLPVSEWPLQTLVFQTVVMAASARRRRRRGGRAGLGFALTAASGVGLVALHREARRSVDVLEQALVDELGSEYRRRIAPRFSPPPDVPLTRRRILLPDLRVRRRYRADRDIAYGEHGRRNLLDVWRRADLAADSRAPVLFQIHGGAWATGRKEGQGEPLMGHLAERGWVCVAPNYRLSPRATWPDHIVDIKRALAWTKANIASHGGDPGFVVVTGGSAGGHLSALAALTPGYADWQPGFEDADTSVAACVPFYGPYDFLNRHGTGREDMTEFLEARVFKSLVTEDRARWEQASPLSHVGSDSPPFFVLHGTNDSLIPVEQARSFVDELRKASRNPVVYAELPKAQHAFDTLPSVRMHHTMHAVERFLAVVRSEHGGQTPAEAVDGSAAP
jgi:acetyl esterase/lipase